MIRQCWLLHPSEWRWVQGILSASDAIKAVDAKVDGIIVSNHGGRQLDYAPAVWLGPCMSLPLGDCGEGLGHK